MCFELYAGTTKPIPRNDFNQSSPDLSIVSLNERDAPIKAHFTKPEIQYIGSTSCCGCDFAHLMFQSGGWPAPFEKEHERAGSDRFNQESLVRLLRETGEDTVELYGIWNGDVSEPKAMEEISLKDLLDPSFYFKKQGFYKVRL
jgi:hypothetical protein